MGQPVDRKGEGQGATGTRESPSFDLELLADRAGSQRGRPVGEAGVTLVTADSRRPGGEGQPSPQPQQQEAIVLVAATGDLGPRRRRNAIVPGCKGRRIYSRLPGSGGLPLLADYRQRWTTFVSAIYSG